MLRAFAHAAFDALATLLSPPRCIACDESLGAGVFTPPSRFCAACVVTLLDATDADHDRPPRLALYAYGGAIATAIARFKFGKRVDLAVPLGQLLAARAASEHVACDLVVPVPLHYSRLVERGYNQSALLALPVAKLLGVRIAPRLLVRTRPTKPQSELARGERQTNVAGAFALRRDADTGGVRDRRLLLIDDVRTTGATLAGCTEALKRAGARSVATLVLAQTEA